MTNSGRHKEVLSDLMAGTKKLLSRIKKDVDELSTKGRYKLDIITLKNRRARLFRELGMRAYILIKNRKHDLPEVKSLVQEIRGIEKEIETQEKALVEYRTGVEARNRKSKDTGAAGRGNIPRKRAARKPKAAEN